MQPALQTPRKHLPSARGLRALAVAVAFRPIEYALFRHFTCPESRRHSALRQTLKNDGFPVWLSLI